MSFANEVKDFVSAFSATSQIGDRMSARKLRNAQIDRIRTPGEEDLGGIPDPFHQGVPQTSTSGGAGVSTGGSFAREAYDYYRSKGLSHAHAGGIVANLMTESGGRADVAGGKTYGDGGKSGFVGQWNGQRLKNLFAFAGTKTPTVQQQLDFVLAEGDPNYFGDKQNPYLDSGAVRANELGSKAQDIADATTIYRDNYERPSAKDQKKRLQYASMIDEFGSGPGAVRVAGPAAQPVDAGAIPAPDDGSGAAADDGSQDQGDPAASPAAGVQVDPIDISLGPAPQVQPWAMFAESGGAIPAPHYAAGGPTIKPKDPQGRPIYMQPGIEAVGPQTYRDNGWRPRMIGDPTKGFPLPTGPTPSQLAFRKLQQQVDVPAVTKPEAPVTQLPAVTPIAMPGRGYGVGEPQSRTSPGNDRGTGGRRPNPLMPRDATRGEDVYHMNWRGTNYRFLQGSWIPLDQQGNLMYQNSGGWTAIPQPVTPAQQGSTIVNGVVTKPAHPYMEKGGMVPSFESGGGVDDTYTTSKSYHRPGERYEAAKDTAYWQPRKAGSKPRRQSMHGRSRARVASKKSNPAPGGDGAIPLPKDRPDASIDTPAVDTSPMATAAAGARGAAQAAGAIPNDIVPPVQPSSSATPAEPAPGAPQVVRPRIPDAVRPAPTERVQPAAAETAIPARPTDFAVTRQPSKLAPVIDNQGNIIGYTPTEQNGVRPDAMVSPNLPAAGIPGVPGWAEKEAASDGAGGSGVQEMIFGPAVYNGGYEQGGVVGYARGGRVEGGADNDPGYTSSKSYYVPGERDQQGADVQATPELMDHVSQALDGGVKFLSQHFGLAGQQGGIPDPNQGAMQQNATKRFTTGEGATTQDEIKQIDDKIDPERKLSEGDRQMTRLAKMTQWYLQQGRPKDAQASAASLLQYGSQRFGQLGALAGAAYEDYQQNGDKKALWHAAQYLQAAYDLIPDGAQVDVEIKGDRIMGTRVGPDGTEEPFEVSAQELPNMIRGVMDRSSYWGQIMRLADPAGYKQQQSWAHDAAKTADTRAYNEKAGLAKETRAEERALAKEKRAAAAQLAKEDRAAARAGDKGKNKAINWDAVAPLLAAASAAREADTGDDPATKAAFDQAASSLFDALPTGVDRAKFMKDNGFEPGSWTYTRSGGPGGARSGSVGAGGVTIDGQPQPRTSPPNADTASTGNLPPNIYKGDQPPAGIPNAKRANDGSWWMVPEGGGKPQAIVTQ